MLSKICNVLATVILVAVIVVAGALVVPKWFGMQIYGVLSASMEPTYPVGSIVYVQPAEADEIAVDDPITFRIGDEDVVATHRVIAIDKEAQTFTTKGDNNDAADASPVAFSRLVGKAVFCIPYLGSLAAFIKTTQGILCCVAVLVVVILLSIFGSLADKKKKKSMEATK